MFVKNAALSSSFITLLKSYFLIVALQNLIKQMCLTRAALNSRLTPSPVLQKFILYAQLMRRCVISI